MEYKIKAHPTRYGGIEFRSRLEAKWAAMFDQLGWAWDYEPIDLEGWVPDFVIRGSYREVLVEVKPTVEMGLAALPKALIAAPDACIGILCDGMLDRQGPISNLLCRQLGLISTPYTRRAKDEPSPWWLSVSERRKAYDCHIDGDKYVGFYHGERTDHFGSEGERTALYEEYYEPWVNLLPLWAEATNAVQWRPSR